jgi:hypothetical protein
MWMLDVTPSILPIETMIWTMRTELVSIPTDTLPLDGAFYEPESGATAGAVLLFHGNTMNFYVGAPGRK